MGSKQSGLGDNAYVGVYNLSGDICALTRIGGGPTLLDVTAIDDVAHERIGGLRDGEISFQSWFNDATGAEFDALKSMAITDLQVLYFRGTTLGNPAAALIAKQMNHDFNRPADGSLQITCQALGNKYGLEWCRNLTVGLRTDTDATNGADVDDGTQAAAVEITSSTIDNPTNILCAAVHGLVSGDSVIIAGHTSVDPDINNSYVVTVIDTLNFTIPVNVTDDGVGGTCTKINTNYGLQAYLVVTAFTGTDVTMTIEESMDDADTDAYAAVSGGAFTQVAAVTTERIATAVDLKVERHLRLATSTVGGVTSVTFAVCYNRNLATPVF